MAKEPYGKTGKRGDKGRLLTSYTQTRADFIVDKIENGMSVTEVCSKFSDVVPDRKTVGKWEKKHPEFKKAMIEAYQTFFIRKLEELDSLSKELLELKASELASEETSAKDVLFILRTRKEAIQVRIQTLQFLLKNIAPKFTPELKEQQSNNIQQLPQINIISYAKPIDHAILDVTDHNKLE